MTRGRTLCLDVMVAVVGLLSAAYVAGAVIARGPARLGITVSLNKSLNKEELEVSLVSRGPWWSRRSLLAWTPDAQMGRILEVERYGGSEAADGQGIHLAPGQGLRVVLAHGHGTPHEPVRSAFVDSASGTYCLPLPFLGVPREASTAILGEDGTRVVRGLVVGGDGWVESRTVLHLLSHPRAAAHSDRAAALVQRGLEALARWKVPAPSTAPLVLLIPKGERELLSDFQMQHEDVYVLESGTRGLLASIVFRDLARAACLRIESVRPPAEQMLWRSLAPVLALRLARECELDGVEDSLAALAAAYVIRPREASLMQVPSDPKSRWRLEHLIGPVFWQAMLEDWPSPAGIEELISLAVSHSGDLLEVVRERMGPIASDRVKDHLFSSHVQIDPLADPVWRVPRSHPSRSGRDGTELTILYTGLNAGYLDHCGCSATQHGGLSRRVATIEDLREERGPILLLELGDALAGRSDEARRTELEQDALLQAMAESRYDAFVPGAKELSLEPDWLIERCRLLGLPLVAANVRDRLTGDAPFEGSRLVRLGGLRVAVVGMVEIPYDREWFEAVDRSVYDCYSLLDPLTQLPDVLKALPEHDLCIVAGSIRPATASRILEASDGDVDLVLSSIHRLAQTSYTDEHHVVLSTRAHEGTYGHGAYGHADLERFGIGRVDVELGDEPWFAFSDLPLHPGGREDVRTRGRLQRVARELAGQPETWKPTPLAALSAERGPGAVYAGNGSCVSCHDEAARAWQASQHAHAYSTLATKAREWDPACLRCHTTGFLLPGGFAPQSNATENSARVNVGCETCHGPVRRHSEARARDGTSNGARLVRDDWAAVCTACHDPENSPGFELERALAKTCLAPSLRRRQHTNPVQ